jgi:hypothetical protein
MRDSVDEVALGIRGAAKAPGQGGDARSGKIDNFLPSQLVAGTIFQKGR